MPKREGESGPACRQSLLGLTSIDRHARALRAALVPSWRVPRAREAICETTAWVPGGVGEGGVWLALAPQLVRFWEFSCAEARAA